MNKKDRDKVKLREVVHRQLRYIDWIMDLKAEKVEFAE